MQGARRDRTRDFGRTNLRVSLPALAALGACAMLAPAAVGANVLQNPGAEDGPAGGYYENVIPPPSGWATTTVGVQKYGEGGFPTAGVSASIADGGGGANLFIGGNNAKSTATQNISLWAARAAIDRGRETATLSGYLGGFESHRDRVKVETDFLGAGKVILRRLRIGPVTVGERGGQTVLFFKQASESIPRFTRSVRVTMEMMREDGLSNDGYADNLSLDLSVSPGGEPIDTRVFRSKEAIISYHPGRFDLRVAIVRSGTRVGLCNRERVFRSPRLLIPGGSVPVSNLVSIPMRPNSCKFFFSALFAKNGKFFKVFREYRGSGVNRARRQIAQGFDPKTGRLVVPRNPRNLGACWKLFDGIDSQNPGVGIYVLPSGQKTPTAAQSKAAESCGFSGGRPGPNPFRRRR